MGGCTTGEVVLVPVVAAVVSLVSSASFVFSVGLISSVGLVGLVDLVSSVDLVGSEVVVSTGFSVGGGMGFAALAITQRAMKCLVLFLNSWKITREWPMISPRDISGKTAVVYYRK